MNDELERTPTKGDTPRFRKFLVSVAFGTTASSSLGFLVDIVAVRDLGAGALEVGLLNTIETISYLLLALPAGVLLDRINKATAMVVAEIGTALAVGTLCFFLFTGALSLPILFATTFAFGLCAMLFGIASSSFVPSLVAPHSLEVSVARQRSISTTTGIIAPGLAGQLLTIVAVPAMVLFSALCSAISALQLWKVRGNEATRDAKTRDNVPRQNLVLSLTEGLKASWSDTPFLTLVLATAFMNFGLAWSTSLQVPFFIRDLGLDLSVIGFTYSLAAIGALVGTLTASKLISRFGSERIIQLTTLTAIGAIVLFPASAHVAFTVPMLLTHSALYGATVAIFNIALYGWVARHSRAELLARRFSFLGFISMGAVPIGAVCGGAFADHFGNGLAAWVWCLTSAVSCAIAVAGPPLGRRKERIQREI